VLRATQENGQAKVVPGFKVDLTNVVSTPANSDLAIFTTDNALSIVKAKVKTTAGTFIDLSKKNTNVFSLAGLSAGVYTLDVIVQKQNSKAAYEGIIVIGQTVNEATKQIVQKEIVKQETDVRVVFEEDKGDNKNGKCSNDKGSAKIGYPYENIYECDVENLKECEGVQTARCKTYREMFSDDCEGFANKEECDKYWNNLQVEELPAYDGSYQDCITPRGDICRAGVMRMNVKLKEYCVMFQALQDVILTKKEYVWIAKKNLKTHVLKTLM
jgi:hypothetical protein